MADAIVSALAERLIATATGLIRDEVKLVRSVEQEVRSLSNDLNTVRQVLHDAERREFKDWSIKGWLKRLEDACHEMDDVLDEWDYNLLKQQMEDERDSNLPNQQMEQKVCRFIPSLSSCLCYKEVSNRHHIAKKIQQVKTHLNKILGEKDQYGFVITTQPNDPLGASWRGQSTSLVEVESVCGRYDDREILVAKLIMSNDVAQDKSGLQIISIVGSGGLGKTTLAQLVYNDDHVKKFFDLRVWICVSDPFDLDQIAKGILQKALKERFLDTNQLDTLLGHLKVAIQGKKFLLVMDDVWTEDSSKWEPLRMCVNYGAIGSKVLVTTRNERVARMMGTRENEVHCPRVLSHDDCWLLLRRIALFDRTEKDCKIFENIGKKIAHKCKGLPLAAKTIGSALRFKQRLEEWENILNSEIWELEEAKIDIFPHLLLSYNELSSALKRCFSCCAIFPKDYVINVQSLISYWLALGYLDSNGSTNELELRGQEFFQNLAVRSLFQDFERDTNEKHVVINCKMHDIVHDFAQFLRMGRKNDISMQATCQTCNTSLASQVKEYRIIFLYKEPLYICDCLIGARVLTSLIRCNLLKSHYLEGLGKLIHLRYLDLSYYNLTISNLKIACKLYNLKFFILKSCNLEMLPREIGKLIQLRHLDLSQNWTLRELPESICDLHEMRSLNIKNCLLLPGLPARFHELTNLKHLFIDTSLYQMLPDQLIARAIEWCSGKLSCLNKWVSYDDCFRNKS